MIQTKRRTLLGVSVLILCFLFLIFETSFYKDRIFSPSAPSESVEVVMKNLTFVDMLTRQASPDRFIILAMADGSFADMAINLYETSFLKHEIKNFLFVGTGRKSCEKLENYKALPCFYYTDDKDSEVATMYKSTSFIRKMNIRTYMVLDALRAGFTVLHTDLDVVFLKNPLPELKTILQSADIAALWDDSVFNAGFLAIKSTNCTIMVYEKMKSITDSSSSTDDQNALNSAIGHVKGLPNCKEYAVLALERKKYLCGLAYYEQGNRQFPAECEECMVVHNNWIVSKEAKVYRFKEHLTWMYDEDAYYTSKTRKYISYGNPLKWSSQEETEKEELDAVKNALAIGAMLNRTVILPRFHCDGKECPLNSLLSITSFDETFSVNYRENSFQNHPWVPESVKCKGENSSQVIAWSKNTDLTMNITINATTSNFPNSVVVEEYEIKTKFGVSDQQVLKFEMLYRPSPTFANVMFQQTFDNKIKKAFVRKGYRQY